MKVTISFGNPFVVTIYTVALMAAGWGIGAHFGHTISSAWMLFFAIVFLLLHDAAIAILLAIAAIKVASSGQ